MYFDAGRMPALDCKRDDPTQKLNNAEVAKKEPPKYI